jgi:hypothetical protein
MIYAPLWDLTLIDLFHLSSAKVHRSIASSRQPSTTARFLHQQLPAFAEGSICGPVAEDALSVKLGVLAMGGVLEVYGIETTAVSELTETTITQKQYAIHFKCW